jgi:ribosomal protein L7/L12
VVLAVAHSAAPAERLRLLVESGALTHDEYTSLTGVPAPPGRETSRLSILQGGPNKIQDIKVIRSVFRVGLRDAKAIVDNLPQTFVAPMPYTRATEIAQRFQSAGMTTCIT